MKQIETPDLVEPCEQKKTLPEIEISKIILQSIEEERNRIAGKLHDGVCANLAAVYLTLCAADTTLQNANTKKSLKKDLQPTYLLNKAKQLLKDTIEMTRDFSHDLVLNAYDTSDLIKSIELMLESMNKNGRIIYKLNIHGRRKKLPENLSVNLYRIIQEFIHNSQKYSDATNIAIDIRYSKQVLDLYIHDNGKGFDIKKIKEFKTFGIRNIINRICMINGRYLYKTSQGKGVELKLSVPLVAA